MRKWQFYTLNIISILLVGLIITTFFLKRSVDGIYEQIVKTQVQAQSLAKQAQSVVNITTQREAALHKIAMRLAQSTDSDVRNLLSKHELSVKLNATDKVEGKTESKTKN